MTRVLLMTKGHPFEREAFLSMFDDLVLGLDSPIAEYTHIEQPAAQALFDPDLAADFDVFVMYDMPGVNFTGGDPPAAHPQPTDRLRTGVEALLESGKGMVMLHHAVAGWPAWPEWAHIVGGRFTYTPAALDGVDYPDSGYHHPRTHTIETVAPDHPIVKGVPASFTITDETFLYPLFEDEVDPIFRSTHEFTAENFYSSFNAIRGAMYSNDGWTHPDGSNLVGWVKHAGNSPLAYIQFGDGPATYADPHYRTVVANAIDWAASDDAHRWARERRAKRGTFA